MAKSASYANNSGAAQMGRATESKGAKQPSGAAREAGHSGAGLAVKRALLTAFYWVFVTPVAIVLKLFDPFQIKRGGCGGRWRPITKDLEAESQY